jgi:hypothetical protein
MGGRWLNRQKGWLKEYQTETDDRPVGRPVNESQDYGVRFVPLRCPKCQSKDVKCYASRPPVRYHICRNCKYNFKSIEVDPEK